MGGRAYKLAACGGSRLPLFWLLKWQRSGRSCPPWSEGDIIFFALLGCEPLSGPLVAREDGRRDADLGGHVAGYAIVRDRECGNPTPRPPINPALGAVGFRPPRAARPPPRPSFPRRSPARSCSPWLPAHGRPEQDVRDDLIPRNVAEGDRLPPRNTSSSEPQLLASRVSTH
jgi:hypothetical protein